MSTTADGINKYQFSCSVVSDSLRPHGLQQARPPCPITNSWSLLKLMSTESVMPPNHLILCHPLLFLPSIFPSIKGLFKWVSSSLSGGQSIGTSASASVLPINIQDWFPLGLTDLIFLLSKGLSIPQYHSSKASVLQCSAFFMVQLTSIHDYWKNHSFDYADLLWQSNVSAF